jgi:hypothetical protein
MNTPTKALPALPNPAHVDVEIVGEVGDYKFYTAEQMREYATAALAAQDAALSAPQAGGEVVELACPACGHVGKDFVTNRIGSDDWEVFCPMCDCPDCDELPRVIELLIREREEAAPPSAPQAGGHSCGNCAGIAPETCVFNPPSAPADGEAELREWLRANMPGGTVIGNPDWWADRIIRRLTRSAGPQGEVAHREFLGQLVRMEWGAWAREQPNPKPSWLLPWAELSEPEREVDRRIGERIYNMAMDALYTHPATRETGVDALRKSLQGALVLFGHRCAHDSTLAIWRENAEAALSPPAPEGKV